MTVVYPIESSSSTGKLSGYAALCITIAVLGSSFQVGWHIGVYNVPVRSIQQFFNETYTHRYNKFLTESTWTTLWSIFNSLFPAGGVIGGLASGFVADYFGRKNGLLFVNIFTFVSGILAVISKSIKSYESLIIGRFFAGIQNGLFLGIAPLYLSEIPPKNVRGTIGCLNQLLLAMGILVANILGIHDVLGAESRLPYLLGITFVPMIVHVLFLPWCCETPKYLYINKNNPYEAQKVLKRLRKKGTSIEFELSEIQSEKDTQTKEFLYIDFVNDSNLKNALITTIVIQAAQQFSGINAVDYYSTQIFISIGFDEKTWAEYATILLGVVQVLLSVVSLLLIEKTGRRLLLLIGLWGMSLCSLGLAVSRIFNSDVPWLRYLSIVSIASYIVFFSIGPGPIAWLITSELFNSDARGKASSIAMFVNYISNFAVAFVFPYLEREIESYSFLLFVVLLAGFGLFTIFKVPETKNRSVEEVYEIMNKKMIHF